MLSYSVKLSDHVNWQQKNDYLNIYLNIMNNFVNLKINGKQFVIQFDKLHRPNERVIGILETHVE